MAPWAGALYACDSAWWKVHIQDVRAIFQGELWTQDRRTAMAYGLKHIVGKAALGLTKEPNVVHLGSSSGYQAINLAHLWGFRKIILLGFDCRETKRKHFFGDHPKQLSQLHPYGKWIKNFNLLARDLKSHRAEVINCSEISALTCWPKMKVGDAIARFESTTSDT